MASVTIGAALRQIHSLFAEGTVAGLTDSQLLDRFLARRDPSAFEALVARHGPMVLAVCRGVLADASDTEDAFQATFLVLVRKARTIRGRDALGPWLHRVAHRIAVQANVDSARRRVKEWRAGMTKGTVESDAGPRDEPRAALHEELARLPERFRAPVVLCHLEGLTHAQAASQLRCGEATVRRRLAEARDLLKSRLTRRGITPAGGLLASLGAGRSEAAVPATWAEAAVRLATSAAEGRALAGAASFALAERACGTLSTGRITVSAASLAAVATAWLAIGAPADGGKHDPGPSRGPDAMAKPKGEPPAPGRGAAERVEIRGRVLDPDGRAREGVKIYVGTTEWPKDDGFPPPEPVRAASGKDGRFRFEVARDALGEDKEGHPPLVLAALAEGFGPGWMRFGPKDLGREWDIRLVSDDVPVTGRVLDLEGRPVSGASVEVNNVIAVPGGDPAAWLRVLRDNDGKVSPDIWMRMNRDRLSLGGPGVLPVARTDADGRFRLSGVGRDRIAALIVSGPSVTMEVRVVLTTRDPAYAPTRLPGDGPVRSVLDGPRLDIMAAPARQVAGTVRDRDTGKPLAGVKLMANYMSRAVTDARGRYRLTGLPKSGEVEIAVTAEGQPYLKAIRLVGDAPGLVTTDVDFALKRGVWVEGRVLDRASGHPVSAEVEYFPFRDDPALAEVPDFSGMNNNVSDELRADTDRDGRFRAVALPGGGMLAVRAKDPRYLTAKPLKPEVAGNVLHAGNFQYQMHSYHGLAEIHPPKGERPFSVDVALDSGRAQRGIVVGPDGRPVAGAEAYGPSGSFWANSTPPGAEFTYAHPNPGQAETLVFLHGTERLGGFVDVKGDEDGPLRVQLKPSGTVVGRLVDEDGQPRPDVELITWFLRNSRGDTIGGEHLNGRIRTDRDGRFRLERLVPGIQYELGVIKEKGTSFSDGYVAKPWWAVGPGAVEDWGDVREVKIGGG